MHSYLRSAAVLPAAALLIACLSCGGGNIIINPPQLTGHLYLGTFDAPAKLLQFSLPLDSMSAPAVTLTNSTLTDTAAIAVDNNGNVATADFSGNIAVFNAPFGGSTAATFKNGAATNTGQLAFNSAGDLFATTVSGTINVFTHPLTSASTPSQVVSNINLLTTVGAVIDSSGNLIIANSHGPSGSNLVAFAPPYNGLPFVTLVVPGASYRQMAVSGSLLFVVNSVLGASSVDVYNLPINAGSHPAFSITGGIFNAPRSPQSVAVDAAGNLYVGDVSNASINVYPPPLSSASVPNLTLSVNHGSQGMAIGK
jgi:hypothetical protein